jgi:FkbM family methyltransferase
MTKVVQSTAARLGLEVHHSNGGTANRHQQRAALLAGLGVTLVLDVGANVGQYASIYLRKLSGYEGRIASFEPVAPCYAQCARAADADTAWDAYPYGLSDIAASVPIMVPDGQDDLSSLQPLTDYGSRLLGDRPIHVEQVEVRRLDDVIGGIAKPDDVLALKVDVQGHEVAVVRGAQQTLGRVALIECELPLLAMYEACATFVEMLTALSDHGFGPVGIHNNYTDPATGCTIDADVFFVRSL